MKGFFRLGAALLSLVIAEGCTCDTPRFSCSSDLQCPETYSCVSGKCEPCPVCGTGERCAAGACVPALNARLAFTTSPQSVAAGACSAVAKVEARDSAGAAAVLGSDLSVALTANSGTLKFFSNATCASAVTSVVVPAGGNSASFYFKDAVSGARELTGSATGYDPARQVATIQAGAAAALAIATAPQTVAAGACSSVVTVVARDALGNAAPPTAATQVTLSSTSSTLAFFADAACGTPVTALTLTAGTSSQGFYFRSTAVGVAQLTASAPFGMVSQSETITPGGPTALAFTTPSRVVAASACSAVLTVQSQDALGNPAVSTTALSIALTSASPSLVFHTDAACTSPATSLLIAAGGTTASFYFSDGAAGMPSVTATATGITAATQSQTVAASTPVSIAFATPAQTLTSGDCSAATRIEARDVNGNASPVAASTALTLAANAGTLGFFSDAACSTSITTVDIPASASSATFYFRDSATGARTLTVGSTSLGMTSQVETINVATGKLAITTAPQTRAAGSCSGLVTVETQTLTGNPKSVTAALAVGLTSSSGTLTFFSNATCTLAATTVTIAAGTTSQGFYFRDSALGGPTLTVSASAYNSAMQAETITAGTAVGLAFITAQQTRPVGSCSLIATLQTRDMFANPAPVVGITPLTLASTSGTMAFFADAACAMGVSGITLAAGSSTASFYFKDTAAGAPMVTVAGPGLTSASQTEMISSSAATKLGYATAARTAVAGACSAIVTVQSLDAFDNPTPVSALTTIALTSGSTTLQFFSDAGCVTAVTSIPIAGGASSGSFYFRDSKAGASTTTATAPVLGAVIQTQTVTAGNPSKLAFTTASQMTTDISCSSVVSAQVQDANGNPTVVTASTPVALTSSSGTMVFYSDPACGAPVTAVAIAAAAGTTQFYFRDSTAGSPTLTATASGLTPAVQSETVAMVTKKLVFLTGAQTLAAGACSNIVTVQSQTVASAPLTVGSTTAVGLLDSTGAASLFSDSGCNTLLGAASIAAGASTLSFYFKQPQAGATTLTASSAGYASANQVETINAGPVSRLGFATSPLTPAVNTCAGPVTVESEDQFGNYVKLSGNNSITVVTNSATMTLYSNATCTTVLGTITFNGGSSQGSLYFRDTKVGSPTLTVSGAGLTPGTQAQTLTPAAPAKLVFNTTPQTVQAGQCSGITTVGLQDAFSNPSPAMSPTVINLLSTSGTTLFYANAACTTPVSNVTVAAGTSAQSFYFRDNRALGLTVTATSNPLTQVTQAETIAAGPPAKLAYLTTPLTVTAGLCSGILTLQTQDSLNNPSNVTSVTSVGLVGNTGTIVLYSDAACVTAVSSVSLAVNTNTRSFYFKETKAGTTTVTASSGGLAPAAQPETILPANASKLVFTSTPQVVLENFCSAATAFQTQDAFNNASGVGAATSVMLSTTSGTLTFYSNPSCTTGASAVPLAIGASAGTFYFRDTTVGTPTVTVSAGTLGSVGQVETVDPAVPTKLAFTTLPQTVQAGSCSGLITVQSQNANSLASNVTSNTTVNLTGTTFYSDASCTMSVTSMVIGVGTNSISFRIRSTVIGSPTLSATSSTLTGTTQGATITPGPAAKLVFLNSPLTISAGGCSGAANLRVQDAYSNDTTVTSNTTVSLAANPATLTFFIDSLCNTATPSVVIAMGSGTQTFYFRGNTAGSPTVTATSALMPASQVEQVNAASATVLAFLTGPQTLAAGTCSGVTTLRTRDSFGNDSVVGAASPINLTGAPVTFYTDAGCTTQVTSVIVPISSSTISFYFKSNTSGGPVITAASGGYSPANQTETIGPAAPNKLVFTTTATPVLASACSAAVTVQSQDAFSNPTLAAVTVDLTRGATASDLTTTFYSDSGCTAAVTQVAIAAGTSSKSFYFRTVTGGAPSLTVSSTGLTGATQAQVVRNTTRSSTCAIGAGSTSTTCTISPPLFFADRTMLFFQSSATALPAGGDVNVRCALTNTTTITCDRQSNGGSDNIQWHTVEFPATATSPLVRHFTASCGGAQTLVSFTPSLTATTDSFVLFSSTRASNTTQTVASVRTARISGLGQVQVDHNSGGCGADGFAFQVVEYPNAKVATGSLTNINTLSSPTAQAPDADLTRTFVLYTWRSGASLGCDRAVRGFVSAVQQLTFNRGGGNAACNGTIDELHYQRVELPVGNVVQPMPINLGAGVGNASTPITTVDLTRTVAFSGGQVTSGTAWGESAYSTGELFGESLARFGLAASSVSATRDSTNGAAAFTTFVVQFQP